MRYRKCDVHRTTRNIKISQELIQKKTSRLKVSKTVVLHRDLQKPVNSLQRDFIEYWKFNFIVLSWK